MPASDLQPDSDLGDRLVTRAVAPLTEMEINTALERGAAKADQLIERGIVIACALHLAGHTRTVGEIAMAPNRRLAVNA